MTNNDFLTINDSLEPKVWSNNSLIPEVSSKLIDVARKFFEDLGLENAELEDITFTGSLANYNWTRYSDIDLHMLVDFSKIDDNIELVREFFNAKTSLWNKCTKFLYKDMK